MTDSSERGSVAVETAILLPVLIMLIVCMMEFGRTYNVQISLTHAAREGARYAAIHHDDSDYDLPSFTLESAPALQGQTVQVSDGGDACTTDAYVAVTTKVTLNSMTGLLEAEFFGMGPIFPVVLEGKATMRCGG